MTNNDGRWAIQLASTIVHEVDFLGVSYPDAEVATTRAEQNYLGAFGYGNEAILNDPTTSRGTYEPPWPVGTRTAGVNFGYGPRERSRDAREGQPMSGWKTKGVKSRLAVTVRSEETRNRAIDTNLAEFNALAGGAAGEYAYTRDRPVRDAERRNPDLQSGPLGQRRLARPGHTPRPIQQHSVTTKHPNARRSSLRRRRAGRLGDRAGTRSPAS